jgi:hypothetical protein
VDEARRRAELTFDDDADDQPWRRSDEA